MVVSPPSDFRHPGKPGNFDKSPEAYQHASQHSNGGRRRNATLLTNMTTKPDTHARKILFPGGGNTPSWP